MDVYQEETFKNAGMWSKPNTESQSQRGAFMPFLIYIYGDEKVLESPYSMQTCNLIYHHHKYHKYNKV